MAKSSIEDFQVGDKVKHISNSLIVMVVIQIHDDRNEIICRWLDGKGISQTQSFIPQELEKEKPYQSPVYLG